MRFAIVSIVVGLVPLAAQAQDLSPCLGLTDDQARLICYDSLAGFDPAPAPAGA